MTTSNDSTSALAQSLDTTQERLDQLKAIFPDVFSEGKIDFNRLKAALGDDSVQGSERYELSWAGKAEARREIQNRTTATLRPDMGNSVNWDATQNLYIEGENLEVLRTLQKAYFGKVKLIYIDPPYNTGSDSFVYPDDYTERLSAYRARTGLTDEAGFVNKQDMWKKNTKENGQFHSVWLSMMYPRLFLARNLLRDDGVIFVQVDDNEQHNLRALLDEIFGEDNFINVVTVKTKIGGVSGSSEGKSLKDTTEFIAMYAKNKEQLLLNTVHIKTKLSDRIADYESEGRSWKYTSVLVRADDKFLIKEDLKTNMRFYGYKTLETMSIQSFAKLKNKTTDEVYSQYADKIFRTTNAQSSIRQTVIRETQGTDYPMYGCEYIPIKGRNKESKIEILYKSGSTNDQRNMVMFLSDVVQKIDGTYYYLDKINSLWDDIDYNNLTQEGDTEFPNGKKPIKLIQRMLSLATVEDSIALDFFSGSGSTAHALIQLNEEDGGNRQFICVQMPEKLEEDSEAYKAGYQTIADIGRARIQKVIERMEAKRFEESKQSKLEPSEKPKQSLGFNAFKLAPSNFKEWRTDVDTIEGLLEQLTYHVDSTRPDSEAGSMVYELLLKMALPLTTPIQCHAVEQSRVYVASPDNAKPVVMFFEEANKPTLAFILKTTPSKVLCLNKAFEDSQALTNFAYQLKDAGIALEVL